MAQVVKSEVPDFGFCRGPLPRFFETVRTLPRPENTTVRNVTGQERDGSNRPSAEGHLAQCPVLGVGQRRYALLQVDVAPLNGEQFPEPHSRFERNPDDCREHGRAALLARLEKCPFLVGGQSTLAPSGDRWPPDQFDRI